MKTVYFVSLGCPKNRVDSEVMLAALKDKTYRIVDDATTAQIIIVNTCSFIQASIEESIDTLLELADLKETGQCELLVASGCLPQRYAQKLEKELPEVDLFIGTGQYHKITEFLAEHREGIGKRSYIDQPAFIHSEKDDRYIETGASAYLKISEGCNRRCSFCIIPKLRGNVRSRSIESLVQEASTLASRGVKELNLVGQDLTEYGMEKKYAERLEGLLPALAKVPGIEWIRLHYVYPDAFSDELVDILAREKKVVKYLDMPIQHTVTPILQAMNRRLTRERLFELIASLRKKVPDVVFRTSIIVGFPGETQEQFEQLVADLLELNLDYVGVFRYSKEPGTKAFDLPHQVHPATKRHREKVLKEALARQAADRQQKYVGKTLPVLFEGVSQESGLLLSGRISTQAQEIDGQVLINDVKEGILDRITPGMIVPVHITQAVGYDLVGKLVGE